MKASLPLYFPVPLLLLIDQLSKARAEALFGGSFNLNRWISVLVVHNSEGPLGLFGLNRYPAWLTVNLLVLLVLLVLAWGTGSTKAMRHLGFACMIGGALGNLCDLLVRGYVVDFIRFWRFPIFNIADLAILLGVVLVVRDLLKTPDQTNGDSPDTA